MNCIWHTKTHINSYLLNIKHWSQSKNILSFYYVKHEVALNARQLCSKGGCSVSTTFHTNPIAIHTLSSLFSFAWHCLWLHESFISNGWITYKILLFNVPLNMILTHQWGLVWAQKAQQSPGHRGWSGSHNKSLQPILKKEPNVPFWYFTHSLKPSVKIWRTQNSYNQRAT